MCDYQGYEFGAGKYPDSYCRDGRLHDADSDYLNDEDIPCPMCRPHDSIQWWADRSMAWDTPKRIAMKNARSLVRDIRKNRGVLRIPRRT